jgi:flagellar protein FlgJ
MTSMDPATKTQGTATQAPGGSSPSDAKLRRAAKDFEAMFMTEMLHQARPMAKATGVFATGSGERSWQVFMDQALGQAATHQSGAGLAREIEKALRAAQGQHDSRSRK